MTIFASNSVLPTINKNIKFNNSEINVVNGANTLSKLPLCSINIPYEQYQRLSILIPKGQIDFLLSFPMLGIKTTFIAIKPNFTCSNKANNYLKWKFQSSNDAKWSFTNILVLTGTSANPVPPILIDNPNMDCDISVDILVSAMSNDYLNDINAFLYLNELTFDNIHTYNETNSQTLSFFNSSNELAGTLDINNIVNINKVPGKNRIIIDESSENNIILDFKSDNDVLQALSAINWLLLDPATRSLPQQEDTTAPVIIFTNNVINDEIFMSLSNYNASTITKQDFIYYTILSIIDDRDGNMVAIPNNIILKDSQMILINSIVNTGIYYAEIKINDIAGNILIKNITINVTI